MGPAVPVQSSHVSSGIFDRSILVNELPQQCNRVSSGTFDRSIWFSWLYSHSRCFNAGISDRSILFIETSLFKLSKLARTIRPFSSQLGSCPTSVTHSSKSYSHFLSPLNRSAIANAVIGYPSSVKFRAQICSC